MLVSFSIHWHRLHDALTLFGRLGDHPLKWVSHSLESFMFHMKKSGHKKRLLVQHHTARTVGPQYLAAEDSFLAERPKSMATQVSPCADILGTFSSLLAYLLLCIYTFIYLSIYLYHTGTLAPDLEHTRKAFYHQGIPHPILHTSKSSTGLTTSSIILC